MNQAVSIKGIIVILLALISSVWLGVSIVTNQLETLIQLLGVILLVCCFAMGRRIWLLIPLTAAIGIQLRIPGQPDTLLIGQLLVISFSTLLFLIRKQPYQIRFTEIEFWCLVVLAFVAQTYVRNPVGLNIFGGESVGGKPYVVIMIAATAATIIAGLKVPQEDLKWVIKLSVVGSIINFLNGIIGITMPTVGLFTSGMYTTDDANASAELQVAGESATRISFMGKLGQFLALFTSSHVSPIRACSKLFWLAVIIVSIISAALSGYRSIVTYVCLIYIFGVYYRDGILSLIVSLIGGIGMITILSVINIIQPLPPNIQRSLSFIPGSWDKMYVDDAENSSKWRFEMWEEALTSEKWIQNKVWGDGLGFSQHDLKYSTSADLTVKGLSGLDAHREIMLVNGNYHSGPVQTIRTIGYVGLIFLIVSQIRLAVHTHRIIVRYRNTEWFPLTLYVGIPIVIAPVFFTLVFGEFLSASVTLLLGSSMIRLLQNNMPKNKTIGNYSGI